MNNFILFWVSFVLIISIGSTIALFTKLKQTQNRVKKEIADLEKEFLEEVRAIGQLEKTDAGRQLQRLILSEHQKSHNVKDSEESLIKTISSFFSQNFAITVFLIGLATTIAIFYATPFNNNIEQPVAKYLFISALIYFSTGILMVVFAEPIYLWIQENKISPNSFFSRASLSYQTVKTKGAGAKPTDWGNCLVFNTGVTISLTTITTLGLALVTIAFTLILLFILLLPFIKK